MAGAPHADLATLAKSGRGGVHFAFLAAAGYWGGGYAEKFLPPYNQWTSLLSTVAVGLGLLGLFIGGLIGLLRSSPPSGT